MKEAFLIFHFLIGLFPCEKRFKLCLKVHFIKRNFPFAFRFGDFFINKRVVKTGRCGIRMLSGEVNFLRSRPVDGSQAHGARFTACIKNAVVQLIIAKCFTGEPNSRYFRVRGWIIACCDIVFPSAIIWPSLTITAPKVRLCRFSRSPPQGRWRAAKMLHDSFLYPPWLSCLLIIADGPGKINTCQNIQHI